MTTLRKHSWSEVALPAGYTWKTLGHNGSYFLLLGYRDSDSAPFSAKSTTGTSGWAVSAMAAASGFGGFLGNDSLLWTGSQWVAIEYSATGGPCSQTSPDGVTWTRRNVIFNTGTGHVAGAIAWNGSLYVVTSVSTGVLRVATSPDAITWTVRTPSGLGGSAGPASGSTRPVWTGSLWLFLYSYGGTCYKATSSNGTTWDGTQTAITASLMSQLAYVGGTLLAVGGPNGRAFASADEGVNWSEVVKYQTFAPEDVSVDGSTFVVRTLVSDNYRFYTSDSSVPLASNDAGWGRTDAKPKPAGWFASARAIGGAIYLLHETVLHVGTYVPPPAPIQIVAGVPLTFTATPGYDHYPQPYFYDNPGGASMLRFSTANSAAEPWEYLELYSRFGAEPLLNGYNNADQVYDQTVWADDEPYTSAALNVLSPQVGLHYFSIWAFDEIEDTTVRLDVDPFWTGFINCETGG